MSGKQYWRIAAATATGSSHLRDNLPNQDSVAYRVVEIGHGEVVVIAVADGAGSAPRSDEGSQIAVGAAVAMIVEGLNRQPAAAFSKPMAESLVRNAIKQARIAVERYGQRHNVPARELASTLIVAFASDSLMTSAQVGDGAVIAFNIDGGLAMTPVRRTHRGIRQRDDIHHVSNPFASHRIGGSCKRIGLRRPGADHRWPAEPGAEHAATGSVHGVLEPDAERPGPDQ